MSTVSPIPRRYLDQLQAAAGLDDGLYVVIEKILGRDEELRAEWPVAGTTGYEFIAALAGLFTDARGLAEAMTIGSSSPGLPISPPRSPRQA